jgi:hypothetical protein
MTDGFPHCGAFDGNHVLAPRCREREPSTPSAFEPFLPFG